MDPLPLSTIAGFAGAKIASGDPLQTITRISTDSRTLQPGDLFVPIRGENFDGHNFIAQAVERGASAALAANDWTGSVPANFALLRVADTLVGYQQIAAG
ncbi:MAG: Mur ligase domain-containing protein, partial [Verrucomicrobiota bacterium]|nr:Mur ligase domain-containing protein [Verrucomicrobiota bacterium]